MDGQVEAVFSVNSNHYDVLGVEYSFGHCQTSEIGFPSEHFQ